MQTSFITTACSCARSAVLAAAAGTAALAVGALTTHDAAAATISYEFTTTVQAITPAAPGFPASLVGVATGAPVTGLLRFDAAALPSTNPFVGHPLFETATYYVLPGASLSLDVAGVHFDTWSGSFAAFVWDGTAPGGSDGVLFANLGNADQAQFQIGNVALGSATFTSTALPASQKLGPLVMDLGLMGNGNRWLAGGSFTATQPVPEPASAALMVAGLAGLTLAARRRVVRAV